MPTRQPEEAFAVVLKDLRHKKGISQETLALTCDLDRTFISLLERGLRQPSLTTILQISSSLDVSPGAFVNAVATKLIDEDGTSESC
jgi:transcriptional regulator with XRE-family HTH domain